MAVLIVDGIFIIRDNVWWYRRWVTRFGIGSGYCRLRPLLNLRAGDWGRSCELEFRRYFVGKGFVTVDGTFIIAKPYGTFHLDECPLCP